MRAPEVETMGMRGAAGVAIVVAAMLAACTGGDGTATGDSVSASAPPSTSPRTSVTVPDKSGGRGETPLEIVLANENDPQAGEAPGVEEFARQVEERSGGTMQVDIRWRSRESDDVYTATTQAVRTGAADMAFVGNNYWAYEGVTSTQAAQAPLVIRSFDQGVAVAEDGPLVRDLFSGLDEVGVVGLELFPEDFKVLVDFEAPVRSPDDLTGRILQARAAPELYDFFEALGTSPQQGPAPGDPQLRVVPPWLQREFAEGTLVGNLPIYFVYFDLVANRSFWQGLTEPQRTVVRNAAAAAQDLVVSQQTEQRSLDFVAAYCERGSRVNALDATGLGAFEAVAAPVVDGLRRDSLTANLLDRIATHGEGRAPTIYPTCATGASSADAPFPDGTYRFEITDDDLRRAAIDEADWSADTGVYTVTVDAGTFRWTQQPGTAVSIDPAAGAFEGGGTYTVTGDRIRMVETEMVPGDTVTTDLTWSVDADGNLHFVVVETDRSFPRFLYGEPWVRISG